MKRNIFILFVAMLLSLCVLPCQAGRYVEDSIKVDGYMRQFVMYLPDGLKPDAPMVVLLHGYGAGIRRDNIEIAGSGMFTASQPISASDLNTEIAGSGQILMVAVQGEKSKMQIAGSGTIEIGQLDCRKAQAEIAGSGDINLGNLNCKDFNIEIAGSGNVNCEHIDADNVHTEIAGSGDVNLKGTVRHHTKEIVGSGKVNISEK